MFDLDECYSCTDEYQESAEREYQRDQKKEAQRVARIIVWVDRITGQEVLACKYTGDRAYANGPRAWEGKEMRGRYNKIFPGIIAENHLEKYSVLKVPSPDPSVVYWEAPRGSWVAKVLPNGPFRAPMTEKAFHERYKEKPQKIVPLFENPIPPV